MFAFTISNTAPARWSWRALLERFRTRVCCRSERKLCLTESISLGEKRFLAVVQFESQRYLLAGTAASITLLTQLRSSTGPLQGEE